MTQVGRLGPGSPKKDLDIIQRALDALAVSLTQYDHQWLSSEREMYEDATVRLNRLKGE